MDRTGKETVTDEDEVFPDRQCRLILIGKTGSGKSSTGNTILGRPAFYPQTGINSETKECGFDETTIDGLKVMVMDTPGLCDTDGEDDIIKEKIARSLYAVAPGPHAVLLCIRCDCRFTEEEYQTFQVLKKAFGKKMTDYLIVVFAGSDRLEENAENKFENQLKKNDKLNSLLDESHHRYVLFDNRTSVNPATKRNHVDRLISKVKDVVKHNKGTCFVHKLAEGINSFMTEMIEEERRAKSGGALIASGGGAEPVGKLANKKEMSFFYGTKSCPSVKSSPTVTKTSGSNEENLHGKKTDQKKVPQVGTSMQASGQETYNDPVRIKEVYKSAQISLREKEEKQAEAEGKDQDKTCSGTADENETPVMREVHTIISKGTVRTQLERFRVTDRSYKGPLRAVLDTTRPKSAPVDLRIKAVGEGSVSPAPMPREQVPLVSDTKGSDNETNPHDVSKDKLFLNSSSASKSVDETNRGFDIDEHVVSTEESAEDKCLAPNTRLEDNPELQQLTSTSHLTAEKDTQMIKDKLRWKLATDPLEKLSTVQRDCLDKSAKSVGDRLKKGRNKFSVISIHQCHLM